MHVHIPTSHMTKADRRKVRRELNKELLKARIENSKRIDATIMLILHSVFGFGKERLLRFHKAFFNEYDRLCDDYQDDGAEIAKIKLKEYTGIDIDELYEEEGIKG